MDIPGTRQRGRSSFPGRGRNQRPRPPLSPSSAAPQPEGAPGAWPLGEGAASSLCLTPCGLLRDPGPGAGLLQHGVTQPSLPAPSLCLLAHASWLVPPPRSPGTFQGPGQILEVLWDHSPLPSAVCPWLWAWHPPPRVWPGRALLATTSGRAVGPQRLSPVSSLASVCLGQAKGFCFAPFGLHFLPPRRDC